MSLSRTWARRRGDTSMNGEENLIDKRVGGYVITEKYLTHLEKMYKSGNLIMGRDEQGIIETLLAIAKKHNKGYCWASLSTIQKLMEQYQHWNLSERTLRRRLKDLAVRGYLEVIHRNPTEENGSKKYRCNLYKFTRKLFVWLEKLERAVRKVFSFFRRPSLPDYSLKPYRRDLRNSCADVEILWKTEEKGRASPIEGVL